MTTAARGPGSPIRPGIIIRDTLLKVHEASINDLHNAYKERVREVNRLRDPRRPKRRPMVYHSFLRYVQQLRAVGLLQRIREEPMLLPPKDPNPLLGIRDSDQRSVVEARRVIMGLTEQGQQQEELFLHPFGTPAVLVAPVPSGRRERTPVRLPRYQPPRNFTARSVPPLRRHLEELARLLEQEREQFPEVEEFPEFSQEFQRLSTAARGWLQLTEDRLEQEENEPSPNEDRVDVLSERIEGLTPLAEALESEDTDAALEALDTLE